MIILYSLLIIIVNVIFYYRTLKYNAICDDIPVFNQPVEIPKGWWMFFWYHLHGRKYVNVKFCHILVMCIHTLNCLLIYWVFGHNTISLLASLLFALNPVNNQGSMWVSGKGYAMNLTCALLMWGFPLASPIIYLYGTYFNGASLIFFPLVFLFTKHWYLAFLAVLGLWREYGRVFDKKNPQSKFNTESNAELLAMKPRKLILMMKSLGYYTINSIFAFRLGFYHKHLFLYGVNAEENKKAYKIDKYFWAGVVMILITLFSLRWTFGLAWFCITIAMWTNVVSFNQTITLRYTYLPNAGLLLVIASLIIKFPLLAVMLLTYYATKLSLFVFFYKNEYWSIEHSCMEQPDFFYPWQNRAVHCFQNQNYHGALGNMIKANQLRPNDWKILYNLCQIYMMLGNINACKDFYAQAKKCNIDGREMAIKGLMERLGKWIEEIETQAKINNQVNIDLGKFDMQR